MIAHLYASGALCDDSPGRRIAEVEQHARARIPLVCDGLGIVWVVGHRIAERVKLTDETHRRLIMRWDEVP